MHHIAYKMCFWIIHIIYKLWTYTKSSYFHQHKFDIVQYNNLVLYHRFQKKRRTLVPMTAWFMFTILQKRLHRTKWYSEKCRSNLHFAFFSFVSGHLLFFFTHNELEIYLIWIHFLQQQVQNFGEPFFLIIHEGETLAEVKLRIQKKLQVPDEEFSKV